jgi:hypothetical protein
MTQRPATVNFRLYPGATFSEVTSLLDSAGVPVDLSGRTALMHIRRDPDDPAPVFELSTTNGGIVLDAQGGISLNIAATATSPALTPPVDSHGEVWYHDLLLTDPDTSVIDRLYQGVVIVLPGVTRPAAAP